MRVAHGRIGDAVVAGVDGIAEHAIGDAAKGVSAAKTFLGRVEAAMPVVECRTEQTIEHDFKITPQLSAAFRVLLAQHLFGEASELQWVVVGEGHAHAERLAKAAASQCRYGRGERMQGCSSIDPYGLPFVAQLAGVASRATDIQVVDTTLAVGMAGKAYGQICGVGWRRLLRWVDQKAKAGQVIRSGEFSLAQR
ncbi:hypothetical protein D9M68_695280 [compost metagenome]